MPLRTFFILLLTAIAISESAFLNIPGVGKIVGNTKRTAWTNKTYHEFLSVKYGESTSGDGRFMPSTLAQPWDHIYEATIPRSECAQSKHIYLPHVSPDLENCLTMNIFTPKLYDERRKMKFLPVMVYIHGGAFNTGGSQEFPPNYILEHNVVLVVPQYRLGVLGFMSLHTDNMPGNVGLIDQLLALEWIQRYIKHFGGDKTQVTLFGQSAGACSISLHLTSLYANPLLFQKVILQSGSLFADWYLDLDPVSTTKALYRTLTDNSKDVNNTVIEHKLKNVHIIDLLRAAEKLVFREPFRKEKIGRVVIQKAGKIKYLSENPVHIFKTGSYRSIPMIIGATKHDGSFLVTDLYDYLEDLNILNNDKYLRKNIINLSLNSVAKHIENDGTGFLEDIIKSIFFRNTLNTRKILTFKDLAPALIDLKSVSVVKAPILRSAKYNAEDKRNTYVYALDYRGEYTRFGFGKNTSKYPFEGGVHHSDDLLYIFPFPYKKKLNDADTKIAKMITELWTSFASTGKPTSSLLNITWEPFDHERDGPYLHIDTEPYIGEDFIDNEYIVALSDNYQ